MEQKELDNRNISIEEITNKLNLIIPFNMQEKCLTKLKTLNIEITSSTKYKSPCYVYEDNAIYIPYNFIVYIEQNNLNLKEFMEYILTHELLHFFTTTEKDNVKYSGVLIKEDKAVYNLALNEGITDYLALGLNPKVKKHYSGYYFETLIVAQLANVIGNSVILHSYFNNLGREEIDKELHNSTLLNNLEKYHHTKKAKKNKYLGLLQLELVKLYLEKQNIEKLEKFRSALITEKKLVLFNKNIKDYPLIDDSLKLLKRENNEQGY